MQKFGPNNNSPIDDMNEDTFIMNVVRPIIDPFLKDTTLLKREGYNRSKFDLSKDILMHLTLLDATAVLLARGID